ncbi:MAG: globin [Gammaproteobacteria bacterium]|nr:globin [Gammaproteobacteria bacterium]MDH5693293.1 globin [Gammaproteobacteria bacterium]
MDKEATTRLEEVFLESRSRCLNNQKYPSFYQEFYSRLIQKLPQGAELFASVEHETRKNMLDQALNLLDSTENVLANDQLREYWFTLSSRHHDLGLNPKDYDVWFQTLMSVVRNYDPEINNEIENAWRFYLDSCIRIMKIVY